MTARATSRESLGANALVSVMFAWGPIALYASRSIVVVLMVALALIVAIAGSRLRHATSRGTVWLAAISALLMLAGMSIGWARSPLDALDEWWRTALVVACASLLVPVFSVLDARTRTRVLDAVSAGFTLLIALLIAERVGGGVAGSWIKGYQDAGLAFTSHASAQLVIMVWPLAAWVGLRRGRTWALALVVAVFAVVSTLPLAAAVLAILGSAGVWLLVARLGRSASAAVTIMLGAALLLAPLLLEHGSRAAEWLRDEGAPTSWAHRLTIWKFYSERTLTRPLFGHGMGHSKRLSQDPQASAHYARIAEPVGGALMVAHPPLHPHNAALQLWHDLGFPGVALALVLLASIARAVASIRPALAACAMAQVMAVMVIWSVSFGLWQKWWLAAIGLSAAFGVAVLRAAVEQARQRDA